MTLLSMDRFLLGLMTGLVASGALSAIAARVAWRRMLRLQQRAKQAERLAELGTLTGGLAHEIKNPLSTIQLNLQLLQEDLKDVSHDDPAAVRLTNRLNTCERETGRLREILDDFLRYAGKMELDRGPVELNGLCDELVDFFIPQAQLNRVQLRLQRSPEPVVVQADEKLVKQAVLNLMLNGMQAMPNGGELILRVSGENGEGRIDVIDTGTGIPPDAVQRIFDAYYSTKRAGTGLGLAMTRRIAEEHGGRVTVSSEPGRGSDFSLHLPMR